MDFNLLFVSEPPLDHFCPVCTDPLSEPYLTDCGHHFCYTCRGRLLASGKSECPECREQDALTDARLNKHLQRQVNNVNNVQRQVNAATSERQVNNVLQ